MRTNPFKFSDDNKRYHTLSYHNRRNGIKAFKAAIDGGFTCPNKDGTKGTSGCIFCGGGSGYFTQSGSIEAQLESELMRIKSKNPDAKAIAYFQANSNTYAPIERLKEIYEIPLKYADVCGLSIATRCDCFNQDIYDYLEELSTRTYLTVEVGLQSIHNETGGIVGRGHTFEEFLTAFHELKKRNIRTCVHVINGLPNETEQMMFETAEKLGRVYPDAIKIHLLHIIKGTELEKWYYGGRITEMSMNDYVSTVVRQLEVLPETTVIERITGDGDKRTLIAPIWSMNKIAVLGAIDKMQAETDSWQGKCFGKD